MARARRFNGSEPCNPKAWLISDARAPAARAPAAPAPAAPAPVAPVTVREEEEGVEDRPRVSACCSIDAEDWLANEPSTKPALVEVDEEATSWLEALIPPC